MIPVFQQVLHDPNAGQYGDCHRAAIATVLGLPPDDVPHFGFDDPPAPAFFNREREFLARFNLYGATVPFSGELTDVLRTMSTLNGSDFVYLLGGKSPRGTNHTVVCRGDQIEHDPNPKGGGLVEPCSDGLWWLTFFVAADLMKQARLERTP
jgi:hypothetical protein